MVKLTERQQRVFDFIRQFMDSEGMPPTRADIARALGFKSPNAAEDHLKALARKGFIEMIPGASRGIRLPEEMYGVEDALDTDEGLPLVGRVAAGNPILAEENIESRYRLDPDMFHPRPDYLLRVRGMSMVNAGILDGDLLAVHRTQVARDGQIVVARIEDEVTVKRFSQKGHQVSLLPENPDFEPIEIDLREQSLAIEGLGVGIIRNGGSL